MDVLWEAAEPLSVREVSGLLTDRDLAHTTVMTVLDRLAKKGFARRERNGRAWHYRAAESREAYVTELMLSALDQTGDRQAALARFARSVSGTEAETLLRALSALGEARQGLRPLSAAVVILAARRHRLHPRRQRARDRILAAPVTCGGDRAVAGDRPWLGAGGSGNADRHRRGRPRRPGGGRRARPARQPGATADLAGPAVGRARRRPARLPRGRRRTAGGAVLDTAGSHAPSVLRARQRQRTLLSLLAHGDPKVPGALVVDHPAAAAYCLPGLRSAIVISAGALNLLNADELAAVLAHERAHLRERHDLVLLPFTALLRAFGWAGVARQARQAVGCSSRCMPMTVPCGTGLPGNSPLRCCGSARRAAARLRRGRWRRRARSCPAR